MSLALPAILIGWSYTIVSAPRSRGVGGQCAAFQSVGQEFTGDGFSVSLEQSDDARIRITFGDLASFVVCQADRTITCEPLSSELPAETLEHLLLDHVVPRLIGQQGNLVLHGAGIALQGQAILFLGDTGRGKSTLATSFYAMGNELLGDDAMVISVGPDGSPTARSIYPSLRLLPDSRNELLPPETLHQPISAYTAKERIDLPAETLPDLGDLPIAGIFFLEPPTSDAEVRMERMNAVEYCMTLTRNSFALDPTDNRSAASRLNMATSLTRRVPGYRLHYPRNYSELPRVGTEIIGKIFNHEQSLL